ncbi:hypothetical protein Cgig2_011197 [Carnegiea gigantea]|uniref:Uncharacterized protein n=1 Tax=Carnegiea gigantea TaxID=171969 RepID=A0A9Q1QHS1_9CARY|nr:hypothetical protein Cgig2_011197 [Carnegiea gigantea]
MNPSEKNGLQEIGNQKIRVSEKEDGGMRSDSFVIDLESFSNGHGLNKESAMNSTNSRITLQRALSRKGPQRGTERNINDIDNLSPSSPPGAQVTSMSEKPVSPLTPSEHTGNNNQLPQHQIIIKTGSLSTSTDGKSGKRSSFKRSSASWFCDPKRILLFFATL